MKRILLTTIASSALALAAPCLAAAAHHGRARHHAHHARARHHRAATPRLLQFGAGASSAAGSNAPVPSSTPATGTAPAATAGETAGTVQSFTGGVLTIALANGSTVSGQVTEATEIHCQAATPASGGSGDQGDEGNGAQGEDGAPSTGSTTSARGDIRSSEGGGGGQDGQDGEGGEDGGASQSCTSSALVPGAVVREAELSVSGSGAVWDHIDLIQ